MTLPLTKVLYVEDDADIREVTNIALEVIGGLVVRLHASGTDALLDAESFAPDLLLLDVMMPGMDGPTTLAALRAIPALATTPAIFMTAKVQPREVAALKALGAIGVIAKPFDPLTLADIIRGIWNEGQE